MEENKDIKMTQELRQAVADIKAAILLFWHRQVCFATLSKGNVGYWRLGSYQQPAAQGTARTERLFGHQPEEDAIVL